MKLSQLEPPALSFPPEAAQAVRAADPAMASGPWLAREAVRRAFPEPVRRLLVAVLVVRVATALLAFMAQVTIPQENDQGFGVYRQRHAFWDNFARHDSGWYHGIARNGYAWVEGGRNNLAFFPVYPLMMRAAGVALGGKPAHYYFGGILVSWLSCAAAMALLFHLARLDVDVGAAERGVMFALFHPFAFFFGVVYAESTFLFLTIAAFYGFRTRRWALGGGAAALACATRVNGIMMAPALAWLAWTHVRADRRQWRAALAAVAVVPAGLVAYSWFCYSLSGNPLEWMDSIRRWGYHPGGLPWDSLHILATRLATQPYHYLVHEQMAPYDTLNGLAAVAALVAVPAVWWRLGTGYALFMLANLALPLSSGQYEGLGRYTAVLFPIPILLGLIEQSTYRLLAIGLGAAFYMLCLALFVNVHPIF